MRRLRTCRSIVLFCIGVAAFAGLVSFGAAAFSAILTPLWLLGPALLVLLIRRGTTRCDEQPTALLSVLLSRAPPVLHVAA
jgi:hypothetical protein